MNSTTPMRTGLTNKVLLADDYQRKKQTSVDILAVTVNVRCKASVGVVWSDVWLRTGRDHIMWVCSKHEIIGSHLNPPR